MRPINIESVMNNLRVIVLCGILLLLAQHNSKAQLCEPLKISSDGIHLETESGIPFFWLGDTAWELIHRLDRDGVDFYLEDRADKGFTVIQTVILAELDGLTVPNAYGDLPFFENDPSKMNWNYFDHVDYVIQKANSLGIYIALLPTWGDKFNKKNGLGPEIFTTKNAELYGQILGERYLQYSNLIWILGGDRNPETKAHYEIIRAMAQGIRSVDIDHLITYHPKDGALASDLFSADTWLDIDMFQSRHSQQSKDYQYVDKSRKKRHQKPVIQGEARYENIPDRYWISGDFGWLDDADVRVSAYWSMLAGAAGYTYGCNDVWQMYETGRKPELSARTDWFVSLNLPGARQMTFMKQLFESIPWQTLNQNQAVILNENPKDERYIIGAVSADSSLMMVYTPYGEPLKIDTKYLDTKRVNAMWFNPRSGQISHMGILETQRVLEFTPWASGRGSDFLLILTAADSHIDFSAYNEEMYTQ